MSVTKHVERNVTNIDFGIIAYLCDVNGATYNNTSQAIREKWPSVREAYAHAQAAYGDDLLGGVQTVTVDKGPSEDGGEFAMIVIANMFALHMVNEKLTADPNAMSSTLKQVFGLARATGLPVHLENEHSWGVIKVVNELLTKEEFRDIVVNVFTHKE